MSISLREQMVQIGLATNEQAEAAVTAKSTAKHKKKPSSAKAKTRDKSRDKPQGKKRPQAAKVPSKPKAAATKKAPAPEVQKSAEELLVDAQRKAVKAQIKTLIEEQAEKEIAGEVAYNYQVGERVRQLYTTEAYRDRLAKGELAITRLNRQKYLSPPTLSDQILALNAEWLIVYHDPNVGEPAMPEDPASEHYQAYQVPDDLKW